MTRQDAHDEYESVSFTELAGGTLDEIRKGNSALFGRILQDIHTHLTAWTPGTEDRQTIKHLSKLSSKCQRKIYRLKSKPTMQRWRVFFTYLDGKKPPVRLVLAVVEYENEMQCYNDMAQPHMKAIRSLVLDASTRGDFKGGRGW